MRHATTNGHGIEDIQEAISKVRVGLNDLGRGIVDLGKNEASSAQKKLHEEVEALQDVFHKSSDQTKKWVSEAKSKVEEHPFLAIGASFGLGWLIASLTRKD